MFNGAGDEARTHDPKLGRLVLYQLSYTRLLNIKIYTHGGAGWIRTSEGKRRQIYSLLPLATREPRHLWSSSQESNLRPSVYKTDALPTELELHRHTSIKMKYIYNSLCNKMQVFKSIFLVFWS